MVLNANVLVTAVEIVVFALVQVALEKENASVVMHANVTKNVMKPLNVLPN